MIDMHAHWRPAEIADALRARTREPRILRNPDGVEELKSPRMGEEPVAKAFDEVDFHLARMDRQGVETSVLSLLGSFCWVEAQPLDVSLPLCRSVNDGLSAICQKHPGRFAAYAALPLIDVAAAAAELERALGLPGMIGAQMVAKSDADGYTFLVASPAEIALNQNLFPDIAYDPLRDFAPITLLAWTPMVLAANPRQGLRHSIIHANTPTEHALTAMADLQRRFDAGYPETQAEFLWWIGDNYAGNLGPERSARLAPYQSYVRRGIRFGGGSAYPVTPLPARLGLWSSVTRKTLRGTYGAQPFGTAESIDAADALRSYTTWAAHQLFLDDEAGSLEAGKSADLAGWDRDPLTATPDELKDLKCELTLFRGEVVYRAEGSPVSVR